MRSYPFQGDHLEIVTETGSYEVWYTQGAEGVYIPEQGEYTVSGNNVDGVIVTVKVR